MTAMMNRIETVGDLRTHLQGAMVLEHATIPTYLTALFSIRDGHNEEAAQVIRSARQRIFRILTYRPDVELLMTIHDHLSWPLRC